MVSRARLVSLVALLVFAVPPAVASADTFGPLDSQRRLTQIGPDGNPAFDTNDPAVAYDSLHDQFLLAWSGTDPATPTEVAIYGEVLDGRGNPAGPVQRLTATTAVNAQAPALGYSPVTDQYALVYTARAGVGTEVFGQSVAAAGFPVGPQRQLSSGSRSAAAEPNLAYDDERDQFRVVWSGDFATPSDFEIRSRTFTSSLLPVNTALDQQISAMAGDARSPAIAYLPLHDRFAIVWEGDVTAVRPEIFAETVGVGGATVTAQTQISSAGANTAQAPDVAANPGADEVMVSFVKDDVAGEGPEAFVQRLTSALGQIGDDTRVSTMGPAGSTSLGADLFSRTRIAYHPALDRYLVVWRADNDFPGLVDDERGRYGQVLDAAGNEVASDDMRISTAGPDGDASVGAGDGALAVSPRLRRWLHVWEADDDRPPLARGELETYGRFVGEDGDLDGSARGDDCNDANAAVHPGARDVPDNGIDEDCSGADAVNLDRDRDGVQRPADCDDGNPFIRPGARDIPGNRVDEDCSGADAKLRPQLTRATLSRTFETSGALTRVTSLAVAHAPKGMTVALKCTGPGCPGGLRDGRKLRVRKAGKVNLVRFVRGARLRPGALLEVRALEKDAISLVERFTMRRAKAPKHLQRCLEPGAKKTSKCPA
jgi:putative metal-binding protein